MDADTLIIDPAVAIHHTLPPDTLDPEPLILGQVDFNGFCNGVIFYKVCTHISSSGDLRPHIHTHDGRASR